MTVLIILFIISLVLNIVIGRLLYIASKRLLEFQDFHETVASDTSQLVEYCSDLARKDLLSTAPEVIKFHKMVVNVAKNFPRNDG